MIFLFFYFLQEVTPSMNINSRQGKMLRIIRKYQPITLDLLTEKMGTNPAQISGDLALLSGLELIDCDSNGLFYPLDKAPKEDALGIRVGSVMTAVRTFDENTPLKSALISIILDDADCIIITKDNKLSGILTPSKVIKTIVLDSSCLEEPLFENMSKMPNILYVTKDDYVSYAVTLLLQNSISHLPVIASKDKNDEDYLKVVGFFSKTSITKLYSENIHKKLRKEEYR